jgi:transposase
MPAQERALETVLLRCRTLYNCALEQRKTWWGRGKGIGASYYQQKAELPDLKAVCPEYAEVHSQVLQDVLLRGERMYQAFFRRVKDGETPGYPRFQGAHRHHSCTYAQYGNGAVLDGRMLSLSKIGRIPIRLHRPLAGTPKTVTISKEPDGGYVSFSCVEVPVHPLPPTFQETGIDVGLKAFLVTADGEPADNPRHYRTSGEAARQSAEGRRAAQEGQYTLVESRPPVRQEASAGASATHGLSPQDGACPGASLRCDLSRRFAGPAHGAEPPPGQEHLRCWVGRVPHHAHEQSSICWQVGCRGAACVHQPGL